MAQVEKIIDTIRKNCEGFVQAYNEALRNGEYRNREEAETNLKAELKRYRKQKADDVVSALSKEENPIMAAVMMLEYPVLKDKKVREDGVETGIELVEQNVRVDLVKVAEASGLSTVWQYKVEYLGLVMAIRLAKDLNNPAIAKAMKTDYRMKDLARKLANGETPTSNTQVVKLVQGIMDEILPGSGKVNNHDIKYLENVMTKAGREAKTVQVGGTKQMHGFFLDMMNAIITESGYGVSYKKEREKKADAPKSDKGEAETVKVEAPAA